MGLGRYGHYLEPLDHLYRNMGLLVETWSDVNSYSTNLQGLERTAGLLMDSFSRLGGELLEAPLPPQPVINSAGETTTRPLGKALIIYKRSQAKLKVFLGGHMDTVYSPGQPFQKAVREGDSVLRGPGVADAKGGLVVMLKALETFESSPFANGLGWEVLINPDEELGSPGSASFLAKAASRNDFGLVFEPSLPDGTIARTRKGSGNFTVVVRGRSAHVGRDYHRGRSAIAGLAELIAAAEGLNGQIPNVTVNVGHVEGGGPLNVVPDLAIARLNIRIGESGEGATVQKSLNRIVQDLGRKEGLSIRLHGEFNRPPKPETDKIKMLFEWMKNCAEDLGIPLSWHPTGGACDGNNLAAAGLANLDSMGVRGGDIHTDREYLILESLLERSRLTALFLMRLASGEIRLPDHPESR